MNEETNIQNESQLSDIEGKEGEESTRDSALKRILDNPKFEIAIKLYSAVRFVKDIICLIVEHAS